MIDIQDDYEWAVIRLATLQRERKQPGQLLFASVSLLAPGRTAPEKMDGTERCSVSKREGTIYFRRVVLTTKDAIDWYLSLGNGNDKTPMPSRNSDIEKNLDGIELKVSKLEDDLIWPHLGLPIGDKGLSQSSGWDNPAPFIGDTYARIHRRFGSQEGFDEFLADNNAVLFITRRMHIDLRKYPEYLGSAVFISPDPVIKKIDNFMIPAKDGRGERIFYRFVPRPGQTLEQLKLITFDVWSNLLTNTEVQDIPMDGILDIEKGSCKGDYGYIVTHETHGVLAYMPLTGFLREMNVTTSIVNKRRNIRVPTGESANSPHMEYSVESHSGMSMNNIKAETDDAPRNSIERVSAASFQRKKADNARTYGQRWFDYDSREMAMRFIQGEIKKARSRVIIADPYFADLQLGQFLYAVNGPEIEVMLLTSMLAFNSRESASVRAHAFKEQLDQLAESATVSTKTHVLAPSLLHDRFLVVDDDVWFLGSSLNSLGDKSSLIVKLPDPDDVVERLLTMSMQAESFEDYLRRV